MVLGDPGGIETAALGMHDLRDRQSVALGRIRLIEEAREKAEAYRRRRCRHPLNLAPCWRRQSNTPRRAPDQRSKVGPAVSFGSPQA
jgi:hypothetical protein